MTYRAGSIALVASAMLVTTNPCHAQMPHLTSWADVDTQAAGAYEGLEGLPALYPPGDIVFGLKPGTCTFDAAGELASVTNSFAAQTLSPTTTVWTAIAVEQTDTPRRWHYYGAAEAAFRTNAVPTGFDPQQWVSEQYGTPPSYLTGNDLADWYLRRDRSRLRVALTLVASNEWPAIQAAWSIAATNPPAGTPPVPPADTNQLAFAGIGAGSVTNTLRIWLYTPVDEAPVDLFGREDLLSSNRWDLLGTLDAAAPFDLWHAAQTASNGFFNAAWADLDTDGDGISDGRELLVFGTSTNAADSDGDGLDDAAEIGQYECDPLDPDTDDDGLTDGWEALHGFNPLAPADAVLDSDGDGLSNLAEYGYGTDPNDTDTDNDGLSDWREVATGRVVAWGDNWSGQTDVPPGLNNVVAVSAGDWFTAALLSDGRVRCWGNLDGVLASNAVAISAGASFGLALQADGRVTGWGDNSARQLTVPVWVTNAVAVSAGGSFALALLNNGRVAAWGDNTYGQTNMPQEVTNVVAISAGDCHALALRADGTVVAWGDDSCDKASVPVLGTNALAVAAGACHSLALLADGYVVGWGDDTSGQAELRHFAENDVTISAGGYHNLGRWPAALILGWGWHGVEGWGENYCGQADVPPQLDTGWPAVDADAGRCHSAAIRPLSNPLVTDSDGDGLDDREEAETHGADPLSYDTDGDGMDDGWEVTNGLNPLDPDDDMDDPDGDDIPNFYEYVHGTDPSANNAVPETFSIHVDCRSLVAGQRDGSATAPFLTLADALAVAGQGTVVRVHPGVYRGTGNVGIWTDSPSVLLRAEGPLGSVIFDGEGVTYVLSLGSGADRHTALWGLGITRGGGYFEALQSWGGSPVIAQCAVWDCATIGSGSGLFLRHGSPRVRDSVFYNNRAGTCGGAVFLDMAGRVAMRNCLFVGNEAPSGGAISILWDASDWFHPPSLSVEQCTFIENVAETGDAVSDYWGTYFPVSLSQSLFCGPGTGTDMIDVPHDLTLRNCAVEGGYTGPGNVSGLVSAPPLTRVSGRVTAASPCIGAGLPGEGSTLDLEGQPRDATPDIGCDEYGAADDSDADGLPDAWELSRLFTRWQSDWSDADGDGIPNGMEWRLGTDPLGGFRVGVSAGGTNALSWTIDPAAADYLVAFWSEGVQLFSTNLQSTSIVLCGFSNGTFVVTGRDANGNVLWFRTATSSDYRPQSGTDLTAWLVTPACGPYLAGGGFPGYFTLLTQTMVQTPLNDLWSEYFVSSNPSGSGAWTLGQQMYLAAPPLANVASSPPNSSLWITEAGSGGSVSVSVYAGATATAIEVPQPIYLLRWTPSVTLELVEETNP